MPRQSASAWSANANDVLRGEPPRNMMRRSPQGAAMMVFPSPDGKNDVPRHPARRDCQPNCASFRLVYIKNELRQQMYPGGRLREPPTLSSSRRGTPMFREPPTLSSSRRGTPILLQKRRSRSEGVQRYSERSRTAIGKKGFDKTKKTAPGISRSERFSSYICVSL